jgi:hypothetical protein
LINIAQHNPNAAKDLLKSAGVARRRLNIPAVMNSPFRLFCGRMNEIPRFVSFSERLNCTFQVEVGQENVAG